MGNKYNFYSNTEDGTHCVQACLRMALSRFEPGVSYSFEELDRLTGHKKDLWTWQGQMLLWLQNKGYKVVNIENLDYEEFANRGVEYLGEIWDPNTLETQMQFSNLDNEQKIARELVASSVTLENRAHNLDDIGDFMDDGYAVMVSINPNTITGHTAYSSHLVLVTAIEDGYVKYNDPGPPPLEGKKVDESLFLSAMLPPHKPDTNLIAIKPNFTTKVFERC